MTRHIDRGKCTRGREKHTGVLGLVRVLLALVEAGLLLLLLDLGVGPGDLVLGLVDRTVTDVGSSRHVVCVCWWKWEEVEGL